MVKVCVLNLLPKNAEEEEPHILHLLADARSKVPCLLGKNECVCEKCLESTVPMT